MAEKKKKVSPKKAPAKTKSSVKSGSKTAAKKVTPAIYSKNESIPTTFPE